LVILNQIYSLYKLSYYYIDDVSLIKCQKKIISPTLEFEPTTPNVFTPNSDGVNDVWEFGLGKGNTLNTLSIFNRWGIEIQSVTSRASVTNVLWDGRTTSGEACSDGVYFYVFEYKDAKGDVVNKKGFITLMK
jgi:gliding motility-associated-like protein